MPLVAEQTTAPTSDELVCQIEQVLDDQRRGSDTAIHQVGSSWAFLGHTPTGSGSDDGDELKITPGFKVLDVADIHTRDQTGSRA